MSLLYKCKLYLGRSGDLYAEVVFTSLILEPLDIPEKLIIVSLKFVGTEALRLEEHGLAFKVADLKKLKQMVIEAYMRDEYESIVDTSYIITGDN